MLKLLLSNSHSSFGRLVPVLGLLALIHVDAFGQTNAGRVTGSTDQNSGAFSGAEPIAKKDRVAEERTTTTARIGSDVDDKLKALEEELRDQAKRLDEMRALITDQQRMITELTAKATGSEQKPGEQKDVATTATVTAPQNQTPTLEDRVKKVENKVLAIGPFRLSGDFRLRFDGIFRKADPTPPVGFAPLTHQQNARMRYRLRLNLDTDVDSKLSFHSQLATGPINNPLTMDQDFGETTTRHPFFINEAWIDYHPKKTIQLQAGRLQEIFADNSRFLFDDDVRFNGFNEKYVFSFKNNGLKVSSLELRAGQYIFSNPNVSIVTAGSPLGQAGAVVGSTGRNSNLFHQGLLVNQKYNDRWSSQFGGDIQLYRNPNQIQLASTVNGVVLIVQNGLGITLSGPLTGTGNATTTSGGAIYTARNFQIARVTYRLNWTGFQSGGRTYPVTFNFQAARNVGISLRERDALLASLQIGKVARRGDIAFLYVFATKGANALISQVTDDDLGTNSGVNIRTNHFRFDYGLAKKVTLQSLLYIQRELRNSGDFPNFFVPLNAFTPRQYRLQEQIVFSF
ncbi:MAG TPA: putative porin [Pyrinomonadaceae bacterium]|nr:putative porin [Pyrinomonadaceae bacterium]